MEIPALSRVALDKCGNTENIVVFQELALNRKWEIHRYQELTLDKLVKWTAAEGWVSVDVRRLCVRVFLFVSCLFSCFSSYFSYIS